MRPMNEQATLDARFRTMVTLWFALLMSVAMFFLLAFLAGRGEEVRENQVLSISFAAVGTLAVIASRFVNKRFLTQSIDKQEVGLVQTGMIAACALCEVAAMLGLTDHFLTGNRYFYVPMIISVIGMLLNFPRRDHLLAATYKNRLE
ncbi:MAG: hypothetical protein ACREBG_04670 [Pyrinomonadaceae bacterium]